MHIILALDVSFGSLISLKLYIILVICFALNRAFVKFDLSAPSLLLFSFIQSLFFIEPGKARSVAGKAGIRPPCRSVHLYSYGPCKSE